MTAVMVFVVGNCDDRLTCILVVMVLLLVVMVLASTLYQYR